MSSYRFSFSGLKSEGTLEPEVGWRIRAAGTWKKKVTRTDTDEQFKMDGWVQCLKPLTLRKRIWLNSALIELRSEATSCSYFLFDIAVLKALLQTFSWHSHIPSPAAKNCSFSLSYLPARKWKPVLMVTSWPSAAPHGRRWTWWEINKTPHMVVSVLFHVAVWVDVSFCTEAKLFNSLWKPQGF